MSFWALSALINAVVASVFGPFVYLKNRNLPNRIWLFFSVSIAFWSYCYFFWQISKEKLQALFWCRALMIGAIFIPVTFLHFLLVWLKLNHKKRKILYISYIISFIAFIFNFTPYFVKDVRPILWFKFWPQAGWAYTPFLIFWTWLVIYTWIIMFKTIKKTSSYVRNQIKYVLIAALVGFSGGFTNYPLWYGIKIPPYGNILVSVYLPLMSYAIVKYRLLDITLIFRRWMINSLYFFISFIVSLFLLYFSKFSIFTLIFSALVLVITLPYLYRYLTKLFEPFVDKVILGGKYLYWKKLEPEEFLKISAYTSLELAEKVSLALYNLLNLEGVSFFVYKKEKKQFRPLYSLGIYEELIGEEPIPWIKYSSDHPFIKHLSKENRIISQENNPFKSYLDKIPFEIILPLFVYKSLKGFILLSSKKGKELFHPQDLERLERLKTTLETHLSHSLFMEERALYSYKLAHDMKNIVEKSILPLLEKTIKMPSQQNLGKLLFQVQFLKDVLRDNFDMGRIYRAIIYKDYPCTPFSYKDIVFAVKDSLENFALSKNLYLKLEIPSKVPPCLGNPKDIYKLLYNLVLNGLKFTQNGGVKITVKVENDEILTEVKDTGCGIPSDRLDDIFTPFFQIKDEEKQEGVGLGLTIVRDIIEANNGKIWVESELNKGTTFYFTLPQAK